jgi:uncharacterized protein (TIGR03118 family)
MNHRCRSEALTFHKRAGTPFGVFATRGHAKEYIAMTHLRLLARSAVFATITRPLAVGALFSALVVAGCGGGGDGNGGGGDNGGGSPTLSLSASPSTITLGEDTTLTWNSSSGTSCTASGGWTGNKGASGSETVTPDTVGAVTYTLTCSGGIYTDPAMASTTVTVEPPTAFSATALISDTAGTGAVTTDANVANPWGLAFGPTTPLWVANNATQTSTVYDGNGKRQPLASPLVVRLPEPTAGVPFGPTGIVFNGSNAFVVSASGTSGPARFIFAGQGGAIAGWSPTVDPDDAVITYVADDGAEYTGLAIGATTNGNVLYAADFANGKVDVFNASFEKQPTSDTSFEFADPDLPEGYAPFGIQAIANGTGGATQVYVAYARKDGDDEEVGEGLGIVNVFDANGELVARLVSDGAELNAPWGIVLAPPDFGSLGGTLLVGNFGDGRIHAFDPESGELAGTIADAGGDPFEVSGLWGIAFGNDAHNQPHTTLFYAAGINGEVNGVVGRIDAGEPPVLNEPPAVTITAPTGGNVSGTVTVTATATSDTNVASVEFFADTTSLGTVTTPPYSVEWDTTTVDDGPVELTARATDTSGNVGTSSAVSVTVANTAPPPAATLTQLQTSIFTPICSVCHDGSAPANGALPGSMDLRAGHAHDSLVGVQSQEVSGLMRVAPGDPEQSYVIHKLEGRAGIVGARMPFGGPFLDDATIDQVRSWIEAGAQDN